MTGRTPLDRRGTARRYDVLLPEYFPVKLVDEFVRVDFAVAPAGGGPALDARISPRRMLAWLRSMPSYRAGVPIRLGQDTGAGVAAEKAAELVDLLDPGRPAIWVARQPLTPAERAALERGQDPDTLGAQYEEHPLTETVEIPEGGHVDPSGA